MKAVGYRTPGPIDRQDALLDRQLNQQKQRAVCFST